MHSVRFRRLTLAAVGVSLLGTSGCFGTFPLTRKLYNFNRTVSSDKAIQELFFLATAVLIPLYGLAALADAVVFNSMEFWTGSSGIDLVATETKVITKGDITVKQTMWEDAGGRTMVLEESINGVFHSRTTLDQRQGAPIVTSVHERADGKVIRKSMVQEPTGSLRVVDPAELLAR
jgi:hypothetical protein